jgi:hypothetical protein
MTDTGHTGSTRRLLSWWVHGEGAAKIRWGTEGDFDRCVRLAEKVFGENGVAIDPKGFCSNRHVEATGARPGHAPGEKHG